MGSSNMRHRVAFAIAHPVMACRRLVRGSRAFSEVPWEEICSFLRSGDDIVEAGAADGLDTVALSRRLPLSRVLACEPVEESFRHLRAATASLSLVTPLRVALGPSNGTVDINVARADVSHAADSSSILRPSRHHKVFPHVRFTGTQSVEMRTLDSLAEQYDICPRFLWLDVQGAEIMVLRASPAARAACRAIFMEVSRVSLYEDSPTYAAVVHQMKEWGFRVVVDQVGAVAGNILFARA